MNIFISYGSNDVEIVKKIANSLGEFGDIYYWDKDKELGKEGWQTISQWIQLSDLIIVLITESTISRSMAVGQEVGQAKALCKTIVPIVSTNVDNSELGFLSGITYQKIDISEPDSILNNLTSFVESYKLKKRQNRLIVGFVIILLLIILSNN